MSRTNIHEGGLKKNYVSARKNQGTARVGLSPFRNRSIPSANLAPACFAPEQRVSPWVDNISTHYIQDVYQQPEIQLKAYVSSMDFSSSQMRLKLVQLARKAPQEQFVAEKLKFDRLCSAWLKQTKFISNPANIISNSNYFKIIGMGKTALPFIYSRLKARCEHWFVALESITDHSPVLLFDQKSKIIGLQEYWLKWLEKHGHTN